MFCLHQAVLIVALLYITQLGHSLRCLSCTGTVQPWLCNTVRVCSEDDDNCSVTKYRTINGEDRYDMGCVTNKACSASHNKRMSLSNRSNGSDPDALCKECCNGNFCNSRGCGSLGYPQERGPVCYSCNQVMDPTKCERLSFCQRNEMCAIYEEQVFGTTFFSSVCSSNFDCNIQQPSAIGKRQSIRKRCGTCCSTDYCNSHCEGSGNSTVTQNTGSGNSTVTQNTDNNETFVLMYPHSTYTQNMYVFMTTRVPGVVQIEVPNLSMKKNITLNTGRNYLTFNETMETQIGGHVELKGIYLKPTVPLSVWVMLDSVKNRTNIKLTHEYTTGYMALPVSKLGKEYVITGYQNFQQFTVTALSDHTTLRIHVKLSRSTGTVSIAGKYYHSGSTVTLTMDKLNTICITSSYALIGTTVSADKIIAVVSGDQFYPYDSSSIQYLLPVSQWGTSFFIPSFPKIPGYNMYLQIAGVERNTTVDVTSSKGTQQYQVAYEQYTDVFIDSPPVYIESKKPIQVTIYTYRNNSITGTMLSIPSINHYRNNYLLTNPNTVTPGSFGESVLVVLPANKQDGLRLDGLPVHFTETSLALSVNASSYVFMTIAVNGSYHFLTHVEPSVKFGVFVFGEGQLHHKYGYSHYGFPAGLA